jgi:UDP-N-acetylmuramate dehydrogenase
MQILQDISLKSLNTFGIDVKAKHFVSVTSIEALQDVLAMPGYPDRFILGGGSNMLLTKDIDALVIHINLKGIDLVAQSTDSVKIACAAGENWHEFVLWCLDNDFGGLENLSLIPGNVGTAPIQNIGAYGVELKDVFVSCEALEIATGKLVTFNKEACEFGYRNSVFKNALKGEFIIYKVCFELSTGPHNLHTSYGAIEAELEANGISSPSIQEISKAVIAIRQRKLPDPKEIGNSGSFFKNPIVDKAAFIKFHAKFPDAPHYIISEDKVKIPAGWLIEQAGFKGKRFGDAGIHKNQALVLVNYGNATGEEIWRLAQKIKQSIATTFNISIEPEVNVI